MHCWSWGIDWAATGSIWSGIGGLLAGIATLLLALFAKRGLASWKEQHFGTRKLELAQDLLAEVYTTEEILRFVLVPLVSSRELNAVERLEGETDDDYQIRQTYDAVIIRYETHAEQFNKVRAMLFRARAILGEEVYESVKALLMLKNRIQAGAHKAFLASREVAHLERQASIGLQTDGTAYETAFRRMEAAQAYFWGMGEGDSLIREIEQAATRCANELRPMIEEVA